jgi:hypothetical protein
MDYEFGPYDFLLPVFPAVAIISKSIFTKLFQHLAPRYPWFCLYTELLVTYPAVADIGPNWKHNNVSGFGAITTGVKEKRGRLIWPGYSQ